MMNSHEQNIGKGVTFGVLAAVSFTGMSLLGKIIGDKVSTDMVLFARFFVSLILLMPWVIQNPKNVIHVEQPLTIVNRSIFTFFSFACFFYALKFIPLSNALLLNNTFPLFIPIFAWLTARSHTPYKVWLSIVLGFIGVGLVLKPTTGIFHVASIIALASGILAAIGVLIIRRLTKTMTVIQILFYNFLICSLLTGFFLPFSWKDFNIHIIWLLLGVGCFGAVYQLFSTLAYAKSPVRITSPLMFLCVLLGIMADWLIWHKILDVLTLIGMICVIAGGIATIYFGQKEMMKK